MPVAPQSWLRDHWRPIALDHGWQWVERVCGNVCQIYTQDEAEELAHELASLRAIVGEAAGIPEDTLNEMVIRLDKTIAAVADAASSWAGVKAISSAEHHSQRRV